MTFLRSRTFKQILILAALYGLSATALSLGG